MIALTEQPAPWCEPAAGHVTAELLAAALALHEAGCCVVPARPDGTKAPAALWKQYQAQRPATEQIRAWLSNDTYDGFGIICGTVSASLEMLEFEGRAVSDRLHVSYSETLDAHGLLPLWQRIINGYTEVTPGGGLHILYRVRGTVRGNTKLARNAAGEVLIETRGEGGFTIVAPSGGRTHPTGKSWQMAAGSPAGIVTISEEDRDALHAVASLLDQSPPPPAVHQPASSSGERDRPGDDFNTRASWEEILTPHGWRCIRAFGTDAHGWRRPGKDTPGISATTRDQGGLYVFSTSTPFDIEMPYSKFAAYAILNHGGDYSAAASQLRRDGYGAASQRPDHDISALVGQPSADPFSGPVPAEISDDFDALAGIAALYTPVDWKQAFSNQPEDINWLIPGFLECGTVNALFAKPGTGKSLIALELAVRIIREGRSVVYIDDENRVSDLVERLQAFGCAPGELGQLHMYSFAGLPALDTTQGGIHLLALAVTRRTDLVILDTTTRMVQGKENDSDTFLQLYRCSLVPLKARGMTVLRLDHPGKDAERGQRGSSAKDGDVDTIWKLTAITEGSEYQLERTKSRSGHGENAFVLTRKLVPLRHDWTPGASDHVPAELADLIALMDEAGLPTNCGRPTVLSKFKELGKTAGDTGRLQKAINLRRHLSQTGSRQSDSGDSPDLSAVFPLKGRQQDRSEAPDSDTGCWFGPGLSCIRPDCPNPNHKDSP